MFEAAAAPPVARFILRGDAEVVARTAAAFGVAPPLEPCRATESGPRAALWLGPDEWLLLAPDAQFLAALAAALADLPHSLVDVSDAYETLTLSGPAAARTLSAGCPLDLHPSAFPPGTATRTVLARTGIILWRRAETEWRLEVGRSYAAYAQDFLSEAARGMPMQDSVQP